MDRRGRYPNWTGTLYPEARALGCATHGLPAALPAALQTVERAPVPRSQLLHRGAKSWTAATTRKSCWRNGLRSGLHARATWEGRRPAAAFFPSAFEVHKYFTLAVGGGRKGRICEAAHPSSDAGTVAGERLSLSLGSRGCRRTEGGRPSSWF